MNDPALTREAGLCASCQHAAVQRNARGSRFWRCRLADRDHTFLRYPPLPVAECRGFERDASPPLAGAEDRGV